MTSSQRIEEVFQTIVANLNCGVILTDGNRVFYLNKAALILFDIEGVDLKTLSIKDLLPKDFLIDERPFEHIFDEGENQLSIPYVLDNTDVLLTFHKFPGSTSKVLVLVDLFGGMTQEKKRKIRNKQRVEIIEFFGMILDNLQPVSWAKNVPIKLSTQTSDRTLFGNKEDLEYIFTNMIGKMIKFSDIGEVIVSIGETQTRDALLIELENKLCKIKDEDYNRMIGRFEKESDLAKELVEGHGGRFWLELKEGLKFSLTIPKDLS